MSRFFCLFDRLIYCFFLCTVVILLTSCNKEDEEANDEPEFVIQPSTSKNKIMALGASRVEGDRPDYESFRYYLWRLLLEDGKDFDFIGTRVDLSSYPYFQGLPFDPQHEGRRGWTAELIADNLETWLNDANADVPDIVLFSSPGGNDGLIGLDYDEIIVHVNEIIDILQANNPNVSIVIEQLAPGRSDIMTPELTTFFNQMLVDVDSIAVQRTTPTSKVIALDIASDFTEDMFADHVHYNPLGARYVASRYMTVLDTILTQ